LQAFEPHTVSKQRLNTETTENHKACTENRQRAELQNVVTGIEVSRIEIWRRSDTNSTHSGIVQDLPLVRLHERGNRFDLKNYNIRDRDIRANPKQHCTYLVSDMHANPAIKWNSHLFRFHAHPFPAK
jgi:hypothetical protein